MNVLILYADPEPTSFNGAMKDLAVRVLTAGGHKVTVSDLYAMGRNAVAGRLDTGATDARFSLAREQTVAIRAGTLAADIDAEQAKLTAADLVVWQFPVWWFGMPAMLKGWADRVLARGFAYLPGREDDATRARQLEGYKARLTTLDQTPHLYFHPATDCGPNAWLRPGVLARSGQQRNV